MTTERDATACLLAEYGAALDELARLPVVSRLKSVSFLGTLSLIYGYRDTTRWDHSLHAAALAFWLSDRIGLSDHERDVLVVYNLLHDVGHFPFSHVLEPLLRQSVGKTFHDALGLSVLRGQKDLARWCSRYLVRGEEVWRRILLMGQTRAPGGSDPVGELCRSAINFDRLEGIHRAAATLGAQCPHPIDILRGVRLQGGVLTYDEHCLPAVLEFWAAQDSIYRSHVFGVLNQSAEAMLKRAFSLCAGDDFQVNLDTLTDHSVHDIIAGNPEASALLRTLKSGRLLAPAWVATRRELWSNEASELGAQMGDFKTLELAERLARKALEVDSEEHLAIHITRWRESEAVDIPTLLHPRLFGLPLADLSQHLRLKKTVAMVPLGVFVGPPVSRERLADPMPGDTAGENRFDLFAHWRTELGGLGM